MDPHEGPVSLLGHTSDQVRASQVVDLGPPHQMSTWSVVDLIFFLMLLLLLPLSLPGCLGFSLSSGGP